MNWKEECIRLYKKAERKKKREFKVKQMERNKELYEWFQEKFNIPIKKIRKESWDFLFFNELAVFRVRDQYDSYDCRRTVQVAFVCEHCGRPTEFQYVISRCDIGRILLGKKGGYRTVKYCSKCGYWDHQLNKERLRSEAISEQ